MNRSEVPRKSALTLAELIVLLGITALVGALLHSAYRTYTVRNQVAEGIATAHGLAPLVAQNFRRTREVPADDFLAPAAAGAAHGQATLAALEVSDGRIDIMFSTEADAAIAGRHVSLTPFETATFDVVWVCGNAVPTVGLNPLGFAAGGRRATQVLTTIEDRFLPTNCR